MTDPFKRYRRENEGELSELGSSDKCGRCHVLAPGPAGLAGDFYGTTPVALMTGDGWASFGAGEEMTIDVPYPESAVLPPEVVTAVREFEGAIRVDADPGVGVPSIREVSSEFIGLACPACRTDTGWDAGQWSRFLLVGEPGEPEEEDA
jgi:hypothetical protein